MKKVADRMLSQFYQNLATLTNSGIVLPQAIKSLKQGKKGNYYWLLEILEQKVSMGLPLWQAMTDMPAAFNPFQIMTVKGGEASGTQVKTFRKLAQFFEARIKQKRRFVLSLLYPLFLLHAVVVLPPIKYLVLPNLPGTYWQRVVPPLLIGYTIILGIYGLWKFFRKRQHLKYMIDAMLISLPVVGRVARDMQVTGFCWILANMLEAGIDTLTATRQAVSTLTNLKLRQKMEKNLLLLEQGKSVQEYLVAGDLYSMNLLSTTAVGEEAGELATSLQRVATQLDESISQRTAMLLKTVTILAYLSAVLIIAWTIISSFLGVMAV